MTSSDIDIDLCFDKIMTTKVLFYDDLFKEDYKMFCERRNITYLPSKKDCSSCHKLDGDEFKKERIEESQRVDVKDGIFGNYILEKFEKHHVLFVYRKNEISGVVHFGDYNRNPVCVYVYALLLEFERKLRELLISHGLNNNDMLDFFGKHAEKHKKNEHYSRKAEGHRKIENQLKMKDLEPFQMFDMKDLIDLLNSKGIYEVPMAINDVLRNAIMHAKNVVRHKDYESSGLIYNFESFREFFRLVNSLRSGIDEVSKEIIPLEADEEYVVRLEQAGLFLELNGASCID